MSTGDSSLDSAREKIADLVERFRANKVAYKNSAYNETQTRREFIDPFFEALGWDVDNKRGYAPAYKDVIHEDAIKVGGMTKAPDYCFRIGGQRKFFVEAKKPSVDMKNDSNPYYQLRRYAYSAKLPLSIVTDFEELAIVDCRAKPSPSDKASTGRIRYWHYEEYLDHLDELIETFSPESIKKGGLDRLATSAKAKRGTGEVDKEFLKEIETWRELLAKNIALRNAGLSQRELNEAVQVTIDRIIFLRICEDRGIEEYGLLQGMQNGANVYARLCELFQKADERYNSGLFHFKEERGNPAHPDELTLSLIIEDKPLKQILKGLYYPDSPYEFSVLPIDILGQVYEQFLGKVIRLTAGHRAIVEDKPEVKKAGGVYYTPTYIVDYIVKNTVGKLLEGSTPTKATKLRILDPACGSGSFLIGAYEYLLDWHRDWYSENDAEKWAKGKEPRLFAGKLGWQLTTGEKKRILLNNIYGVDIDQQAVEVTKLSLLLKVLEEESQETMNAQLKFFQERALPDLGNNIKCGNSLIGTDFYEGQQMGLLGEEEIQRINPFNWEDEFAEIMKGGGFDAVIGNPPYVRQESLTEPKQYLQQKFQTYHGMADYYVYFIEKGVDVLAENGFFGIIVANKWLRAGYGKPLRRWMKELCIAEIIDFGDLPVFQTATTYPCILRIIKKTASKEFKVANIETLNFIDMDSYISDKFFSVKQSDLDVDMGWSLASEKTTLLMEKLQQVSIPLSAYVNGGIYYGIKTGFNEAFVINTEQRDFLIKEDPKNAEIIKPFLTGRDVKRYGVAHKGKFLIFTRKGIDITSYPSVERYLSYFKEQLMPKPKSWSGKVWPGRKSGAYQWYEIQDPIEYFEEFEKPKIIVPAIVQHASYMFDSEGFYSNDKTTVIPTADLYLFGVLNSKVPDFFMHQISSTKRGGYYEYKPVYLKQLPIRRLNLSNTTDKSRHNKIVELVENMLALNKRLHKAKTAHEKDTLQRQIDATDRQIDRLVYKLYDLTDEEIKIVEAAN